jgi:hypothetical protein
VTFYKWLATGGVSPFAGFRWIEPGVREPGQWHRAVDPAATPDGAARRCRVGVHACRRQHLPYWLQAELWTMELDGPVVEGDLKTVAPRARLLRRVEAWDRRAAAEYALWSAQRGAGFAVAELEAAELVEAAQGVRQALAQADNSVPGAWVDPQSTSDLAGGIIDALKRAQAVALGAGNRGVHRTCAYAEDGFAWIAYYPPAAIAEVAMRTRGSRPSIVEDFAVEERAAQTEWLTERLGLADD